MVLGRELAASPLVLVDARDDAALLLAPLERELAARFSHPKRRSEWILGRLAGKAALVRVLAAAHPPDVVVTDFSMPKTNGVELARALRVRLPNVVVVMVTGFPDLPDVIQAHREKLISALIVKPWDRDDLYRTISQLMRLKEMRRNVAVLSGKPDGAT